MVCTIYIYIYSRAAKCASQDDYDSKVEWGVGVGQIGQNIMTDGRSGFVCRSNVERRQSCWYDQGLCLDATHVLWSKCNHALIRVGAFRGIERGSREIGNNQVVKLSATLEKRDRTQHGGLWTEQRWDNKKILSPPPFLLFVE